MKPDAVNNTTIPTNRRRYPQSKLFLRRLLLMPLPPLEEQPPELGGEDQCFDVATPYDPDHWNGLGPGLPDDVGPELGLVEVGEDQDLVGSVLIPQSQSVDS